MISLRCSSSVGRLMTALGVVSIALGFASLSDRAGQQEVSAQSSAFVAAAAVAPMTGDSSSDFELTLPTGAACGGRGVDGYRYHSFLIPAAVDVSTVTFDSSGPSVGETPFTTGFSQQRALNPETTPPGLIASYIESHTMTAYDPAFRPVAGVYSIGVACTLTKVVTEYWSETITITDDASDAGLAGFVWSAGAVPLAPLAPANVVAAAADGALEVSFDPVDASPAVDSYEVTADDGAGGVFTVSGAGSPLTVDGLTNGTQYDVTVTATNSVGTGPASPAVEATPSPGPPGQPTGVSVVPADGQFVVTFTPASAGPPAESFTVRAVAGLDQPEATGTSSPITLTGLVNGTEYAVTVTATAGGLAGEPSEAVTATPVAPASAPEAPTLDAADPGDASITAQFTPSASGDAATSFTAIASALVDGEPELVEIEGSASPLTIEELTNGVEYEVIVIATNSIGDSLDSNSLTATPVPKPGTPVIDSVVAGEEEATVEFTPGSGPDATEFVVTAEDVSDDDSAAARAETRTASGTESPIVVTELADGVTYAVTVVARNSSGDSEPSIAVQVTIGDTGGAGGDTTSGGTTGDTATTGGSTGGESTGGESTGGTTTDGATTDGTTADGTATGSSTGGTTTGGSATGSTTGGTTSGTTSGGFVAVGTTGGSTSGGTLAQTGSNTGWIAIWAGVLLIVGRMVILSGRTPHVIRAPER